MTEQSTIALYISLSESLPELELEEEMDEPFLLLDSLVSTANHNKSHALTSLGKTSFFKKGLTKFTIDSANDFANKLVFVL